jgi:two-component SAPR family response regulator
MANLCVKALEKGFEVPYIQELIRRCKLIPDRPPLHLENWPWPLKIFTLGRFEIWKEGKPIRFSRKVQEKPLQMLKVIIALGGKEVGEDLIEDIIWPEIEGDLARQSFSTTLHRLRQLLGREKAIERQEGKLTLDDRLCWTDLWAFEDLLLQAEAGWRKGFASGAIRQMEKATEIYTGPFLSREADQPWAVSTNERIRNKFLRTIEKLGGYREKAGQWEKAMDLYRRGLEVDDLAEEFYRRLIVCYERLGRRAEALAVYLRCQKILTARLGIEPSSALQALYQSLKS